MFFGVAVEHAAGNNISWSMSSQLAAPAFRGTSFAGEAARTTRALDPHYGHFAAKAFKGKGKQAVQLGHAAVKVVGRPRPGAGAAGDVGRKRKATDGAVLTVAGDKVSLAFPADHYKASEVAEYQVPCVLDSTDQAQYYREHFADSVATFIASQNCDAGILAYGATGSGARTMLFVTASS